MVGEGNWIVIVLRDENKREVMERREVRGLVEMRLV